MAHRRKHKSHFKTSVMTIFCVLIIAVISYTIGRSWIQVISKYQENEDLKIELASLKDKKEELESDVNKLQDKDYIARYAREKYYYSKDGEYVIRIPEK